MNKGIAPYVHKLDVCFRTLKEMQNFSETGMITLKDKKILTRTLEKKLLISGIFLHLGKMCRSYKVYMVYLCK